MHWGHSILQKSPLSIFANLLLQIWDTDQLLSQWHANILQVLEMQNWYCTAIFWPYILLMLFCPIQRDPTCSRSYRWPCFGWGKYMLKPEQKFEYHNWVLSLKQLSICLICSRNWLHAVLSGIAGYGKNVACTIEGLAIVIAFSVNQKVEKDIFLTILMKFLFVCVDLLLRWFCIILRWISCKHMGYAGLFSAQRNLLQNWHTHAVWDF